MDNRSETASCVRWAISGQTTGQVISNQRFHLLIPVAIIMTYDEMESNRMVVTGLEHHGAPGVASTVASIQHASICARQLAISPHSAVCPLAELRMLARSECFSLTSTKPQFIQNALERVVPPCVAIVK